ncbi:MAG: ATP-binding cassette domain-containing protein [Gammaproteobacteria bacterium]|nr:ATP-binding cassette domain-containing protein [Gammaproteobacteria bacterium]
MQPVIRVENLSKRYQLGLTHAGSVRELVNDAFARLTGGQRGSGPIERESADHVWALRDVSFEVNPGEVLGIIGRNGAGKSTLLKILSRITTPTAGRVEMRGRVASLLEVGTGFHPELTGRENVYMNGTVLGMTRREINREFDSIVDFAGVETFIDTPVKRYSSGMTVRLGFAVAAHMSPEILIIDEVLAVGDAEFQRRCLGKMEEVSLQGRTVLFVSHQMGMIARLCGRVVLMENGGVSADGDTDAVIGEYLRKCENDSSSELHERKVRPITKDTQIIAVNTCDDSSEPRTQFRDDESITLEVEFAVTKLSKDHLLSVAVCDRYSKQKIFTSQVPCLGEEGRRLASPRKAICKATLRINPPFLVPNDYSIIAGVITPRAEIVDVIRDITFSVLEGPENYAAPKSTAHGFVFANLGWRQTFSREEPSE